MKASSPEPNSIAAITCSLASGEQTAEDLVRRSVEILRDAQGKNVMISLDLGAVDAARAADTRRAAGGSLPPLLGVPVVVKDNIHVRGLPNTAGTQALAEFVPAEDAPAVARLRQAGAIVLGKSNMHELAFGVTSINGAYGAVHNAVRSGYIAGGSSGGSAVAVAMAAVPLALGTDTGGSCRIPAALNGTFGFRPSIGRYSNEGLTRLSHTRDTVGFLSASMQDIRLADAVLRGGSEAPASVSLQDLRLGVARTFCDHLDSGVSTVLQRVLRQLSDAGVTLVDVEIEGITSLADQVGMPIVTYECMEELRAYLARYAPQTSIEALVASVASADVKAVLDALLREPTPLAAYRHALDVLRPTLRRRYETLFAEQRVDALVFPTCALAACAIEDDLETVLLGGQRIPVFDAYKRHTDPGACAGVPGLSLPGGCTADGLPVGIALDGPVGRDERLLAIGSSVADVIKQA